MWPPGTWNLPSVLSSRHTGPCPLRKENPQKLCPSGPRGSAPRSTASPPGPGPCGVLVMGSCGSYMSHHTSCGTFKVASVSSSPSTWPPAQVGQGCSVFLPFTLSPSTPGTTFHALLSHQRELWVTLTWAQYQKSKTHECHVHHRPHLPMTPRALVPDSRRPGPATSQEGGVPSLAPRWISSGLRWGQVVPS